MSGVKCCYQCSDRYVGCHSKCEKYIAEKKQWEEDKKEIKKEIKKIRAEYEEIERRERKQSNYI